MRVEFAVEGAPVAKARARVVRGRAYTPEATKGYEERVTAGALNAINLGGLVMPSPREPVKANVSIGIPMPVSWPWRRLRRIARRACPLASQPKTEPVPTVTAHGSARASATSGRGRRRT